MQSSTWYQLPQKKNVITCRDRRKEIAQVCRFVSRTKRFGQYARNPSCFVWEFQHQVAAHYTTIVAPALCRLPAGKLRSLHLMCCVTYPSDDDVCELHVRTEYMTTFVRPILCRPDKPVSTQDVWNVVRDHYEGTEFDLTAGLASGGPT